MPQSLHPESRWNRDEFNAVLSGPMEQQDEKFDDYMDAFYEEYQGTDDQKINEFYDHLFQNERQVSEVNWISLWDSVHTSYENWLESEKLEDDWIRAERPSSPITSSWVSSPTGSATCPSPSTPRTAGAGTSSMPFWPALWSSTMPSSMTT